MHRRFGCAPNRRAWRIWCREEAALCHSPPDSDEAGTTKPQSQVQQGRPCHVYHNPSPVTDAAGTAAPWPPITHRSLESFCCPQRHGIAHLKAGKMVILNVIRYAGKICPFFKFQYLFNIQNYFFWPDFRCLPSQQMSNIWYELVANMLESNLVVQNNSKLHSQLHKLCCIPILMQHFQHDSTRHSLGKLSLWKFSLAFHEGTLTCDV